MLLAEEVFPVSQERQVKSRLQQLGVRRKNGDRIGEN